MKKIVMCGPRKSRIVECDVPKINSRQLLVKVVYTGMCHSEWYPWSVAAPGEEFGHETVGVIAEAGAETEGFKVGDPGLAEAATGNTSSWSRKRPFTCRTI